MKIQNLVRSGIAIKKNNKLCLKLFYAVSISLILLLGDLHATDFSQFPLTTFKNFGRLQGLPENTSIEVFDIAKPALSVIVKYTENVREIRDKKSHFIKGLAKAMSNPAFFSLYEKEIKVVEQGKSYWIPVQKALIPYLEKELQSGQEFTIYVRYFGVTMGDLERVYLMIDFSARVTKAIPRLKCFTNNLLGIELGQDMKTTLNQLTKRYGDYIATPMQGTSKYYVYVIDPKFNTHLIIGDAGSGYRNRVYSMQISGKPNPKIILYKNLTLGNKPSEIEQALGKPLNQKDTGSGFTQLTYENSNCSVELKNGVLASILIAEDPNYFSE